MKKLILLLMALIVIIFVGQQLQQDKLDIQQKNNRAFDGTYIFLPIDEEQIYRGNLLLINGQYSLNSEGIAKDLVKLDRNAAANSGYALENEEVILSEAVITALDEMLLAAKHDKIDQFLITSGYRSLEKQAMLYEQQGSDYALPPEYSEHNSGIALDISSLTAKMEAAPEGKWLEKNSSKYGFILRYPEHKQHITGIAYEPWHFRYVGLPHSLLMQDRDLTLEEYIEFLSEEEQLTIHAGSKTYRIEYYNYEPSLTIQVEEHLSYEISGDNVGGIIVTTTLEEA